MNTPTRSASFAKLLSLFDVAAACFVACNGDHGGGRDESAAQGECTGTPDPCSFLALSHARGELRKRTEPRVGEQEDQRALFESKPSTELGIARPLAPRLQALALTRMGALTDVTRRAKRSRDATSEHTLCGARLPQACSKRRGAWKLRSGNAVEFLKLRRRSVGAIAVSKVTASKKTSRQTKSIDDKSLFERIAKTSEHSPGPNF
jgi:hypothetical protein